MPAFSSTVKVERNGACLCGRKRHRHCGMVGSQRYCLAPELFLNARGEPMTRFGFEYILRKHVHTAVKRCPSLSTKRCFAARAATYLCANAPAGHNDLRKVALWLGHANMQTTEMDTRTDPSISLRLWNLLSPQNCALTFQATDKLIAELRNRYCYAE